MKLTRFTSGVNEEVLLGVSNFCVCGRNPMVLPFK